MIWLTWRQFRAQAVTAAAALAAFAVLLAVTGPHLASLYTASGITSCHSGSCGQLASSFLSQVGAGLYPVVYMLGIAGIVLAPAVIGIFWGAPLIAREFEAGTFRLAWTQSITRTRWLAVKLTLTGLAAMAITEALSFMQAWWAAPIGQAARLATDSAFPLGMGPFSLLVFDAHGITPLGYAAFAFTLGVTIGVLLRRTVPAMAITLAIFAAIQVAMPLSIRPHLFPPHHTTAALSSFTQLPTRIGPNGTFAFTVDYLPSQPGAWILSSGAVNAAGQPVSASPAACKSPALTGSPAWTPCLTSHGIRIAVSYQPASRYWPIQGTETAIYLALALALAGFCFWRLDRRVS
jgi:ABC-type transport system involved in multi-copper enzyme maturation permease subunit